MGEGIAPWFTITGAADSQLSTLLGKIQKLRWVPRLGQGIGEAYWKNHSVILAETGSGERDSARSNNSQPLRLPFRPIGTLSGDFDPGKWDQFSLVIDHSLQGEQSKTQVGPNEIVMLVIGTSNEGETITAPGEWSAYMPGSHESLRVIGRSDVYNKLEKSSIEDVETTLARVQSIRGKSSHSTGKDSGK